MAEHPYKYQINFSGMIGFVPHKEKDENGSQLMVLVLDGRSRLRSPLNEEIFCHIPFLYYRLDDLSDESERRPDLIGKGYGMNFLNLEDLTIGEQTPDKPSLKFDLFSQAYKAPEPYEETAVDSSSPRARDLCWIMPIHKIGDLAGVNVDNLRIDDKYLKQPYKVEDLQQSRLAARFHLSQGEIFTRDFQRHSYAGERLSAVYDFRKEMPPDADPAAAHHSQMVSTFVTYEPEFSSNELAIKSSRFSFPIKKQAGPDFPDLIFKNPGQEKRNIYVNVWNSPLADILDIFGGPDKHNWPRPEGNRSFHAYFNLCAQPPGKDLGLPIATYDRKNASGYQKLSWATPDKHVACPTARYEKASFGFEPPAQEKMSSSSENPTTRPPLQASSKPPRNTRRG